MLQKGKVSFSLLFCLLQFVVFGQEVEPQITVTRDFLMQGVHLGLLGSEDLGIKTDGDIGSGGNMRVAIYAKDYYDKHNKSDSFLYGFEAFSNSEGGYDNLYFKLLESRRKGVLESLKSPPSHRRYDSNVLRF